MAKRASKKGWWERLGEESQQLQVLVAAVGVLVAVAVGLATIYVTVKVSEKPTSDQQSVQGSSASASREFRHQASSLSPSSSSSSSSAYATGSPSVRFAVGTCLTSDRPPRVSVTSCSNPHSYEVIGAKSGCSYSAALRYLGGRLGLDVALAVPSLRIVPNTCVLVSPVEATEGSAKEALANTNRDDFWRRCLNTETDREVSCSAEHMSEYYATGTRGNSTIAECQAAATAYLEVPFTKIDSDVRIQRLNGVSSDVSEARCVFSARAPGQKIVGSLRRLRDSQVVLAN